MDLWTINLDELRQRTSVIYAGMGPRVLWISAGGAVFVGSCYE